VKLNQLDDNLVHVVLVSKEFFDVLLEELSVMPPNCDIESIIE
jgi:hypothetical protein